ncbi:MAG: hypothetical protein JXR91_10125 [Deltaproteobacteria bacterium]|nr:hypothetical protein [Deltaproteobacteria bacterium]
MPLPGAPNWDIGEYSLDFKIDQHSLTVICPVEQEIRWARCTITGDVPDELGLSCNMRLIAIDPNDSQSAATGGIVCNTEYYDDSLSVRGPENVTIVVKREGKVIGSGEYEPEYTRNNNYWGDEECGYCESLVSETLTLQSSN